MMTKKTSAKKKPHYHVLMGLQGMYMPNSNSAFRSLRAARRAAKDDAIYARDSGDKVKRISPDLYTVGKHEMIEVVECHEPWKNCKDSDEG